MRRGLIALVLLGVAIAGAARAEDVLSAPWLGDTKYTIHFNGVLEDAVKALTKLTGRDISPAQVIDALGEAGEAEEPLKLNAPVKLDFENATLDGIMLSLCLQAGLVYEPEPWGTNIRLRVGDAKVDPRPTWTGEAYRVRVVKSWAERNRVRVLRWGQPPPETAERGEKVHLDLQIESLSAEANRNLAGLSGKLSATTDKGDAVELTLDNSWGDPPFAQRNDGGEGRGFAMTATVPALPHPATKLARVGGTLRLYSSLKATSFDLPAGSVGKPARQDDVTATVKQWTPVADGIVIVVQTVCPVPEDGSLAHAVTLVSTDGRRAKCRSDDEAESDGRSSLVLHFLLSQDEEGNDFAPAAKPFVADHLRLTITRKGAPSKELPFVIENVPLP